MRRVLRLAAAGGCGAFLAMAYHPVDAGWIAWFGLVPWLVLAEHDEGRGFLWETFVFGFFYMAVGCWWLIELTAFGGVLMAAAVSVLFFLPMGAVLRFVLRHGPVPLVVAGPVIWVTFDWLRSWAFTGFPWLFLAHAQWSSPGLLRIASVTGAYGLTFAIVGVNAAVATLVLRRVLHVERPSPRVWLVVPGASLAAVLVLALLGAPEKGSDTLRIAVIQGNVPQYIKEEAIEKGRESSSVILRRHVDLTRAAVKAAKARWGRAPDLVVWPETVLNRADDELLRAIGSYLETPLLVGALAFGGAGGDDLYNSAFMLDREGGLQGRYDKVHIVPGGEYVPLRGVLPDSWEDWIGDRIREYAGFLPRLAEGERLEPLAIPGDGRKVGCLICYEVIYPGLSLGQTAAGADCLVNLTNYGWFKESAQLEQALAITVLRAVETGRPVVIAANTGISTVIRADGAVGPVFMKGGATGPVLAHGGETKSVTGWLLADVPIAGAGEARRTPYTALGDAFAILLAVLTGLLLAASIRVRIGVE